MRRFVSPFDIKLSRDVRVPVWCRRQLVNPRLSCHSISNIFRAKDKRDSRRARARPAPAKPCGRGSSKGWYWHQLCLVLIVRLLILMAAALPSIKT